MGIKTGGLCGQVFGGPSPFAWSMGLGTLTVICEKSTQRASPLFRAFLRTFLLVAFHVRRQVKRKLSEENFGTTAFLNVQRTCG